MKCRENKMSIKQLKEQNIKNDKKKSNEKYKIAANTRFMTEF